MKLRVCVIFALFTLNLSFMQIPDGVCPSDLSNCLLGDDHALKCYQSVEKIREKIDILRRHITAYLDLKEPYPNPAPTPRINITRNPFCADYYMDWMMCHVSIMLKIQPSEHTGVNNRNFIRYGKMQGQLTDEACVAQLERIANQVMERVARVEINHVSARRSPRDVSSSRKDDPNPSIHTPSYGIFCIGLVCGFGTAYALHYVLNAYVSACKDFLISQVLLSLVRTKQIMRRPKW